MLAKASSENCTYRIKSVFFGLFFSQLEHLYEVAHANVQRLIPDNFLVHSES
jgi:hypothetical protein